jgi:transcriptional regulator with XRE-family HTH domain
MDFGDEVRRFRHQMGLSQRRFGRRFGLNQSSISRLERGSLPTLHLYRLVPILQDMARLRTLSANPKSSPIAVAETHEPDRLQPPHESTARIRDTGAPS